MEFKYELTEGQLSGYSLFARFFMDPMENVMLLKGWSGTGKSTLIQYILQKLPKLNDMIRLVDQSHKPMGVLLTATTNQAAEALYGSIDMLMGVETIHKALGLILMTDYKTGKKRLAVKRGAAPVENMLIVIDEASFIDQDLLGLIFKQTVNCKIVMVGDPGQLTPITSTYMPAFGMDKNQIELTEPVRQKPDTPLSLLISNLRDTVFTGNWHKFGVDGDMIQHVDQATFEQMAYNAFVHPEQAGTSKILAYTNATVLHYNNIMTAQIDGETEPYPGQRMICNERCDIGSASINNGQEVYLEAVRAGVEFDVNGYFVTIRDLSGEFFMPKVLKEWKVRLKKAQAEDDWTAMKIIQDQWADLRPSYACTVNKSQGSTFNTGFIDLNDLCSKVRTGNQLARLLYVGVSRFRDRVRFTGDITIKG